MKRATILFCACAMLAAAGTARAAVTPLNLGKHNTNAPIKVSADTFLADIKGKTGTYSGNVIVQQGDFKLRADRVKVLVVANKPNRIVANGHVVFDAPSGTAQGDNGVYDIGPRTITLTGRVILAKDKNVMRGSTLTLNLITGAATLNAKGTSSGRVQGLFVPGPQSPTSQQNPPPSPQNP